LKNARKYFSHARTVALASEGVGGSSSTRFRLGAVLVDRYIVSSGINSYKTHPRLKGLTQYPFLHAEQHALFKYGIENAAGLDLYVCRVMANGRLAMARPCYVCMHFIKTAGLNKVYYSINQNRYGLYDVATGDTQICHLR